MIILVDLFRKMVKVTDGADESSLEQVCKTVLVISFLSIFYSDCISENTDYRRPMKPFFIEISKFWAWAENLGHLGYFRPISQHPFYY